MAALIIKDIETGEETRRVDVTGKSDRQVDLIERGMLTNMNRDKYIVTREI